MKKSEKEMTVAVATTMAFIMEGFFDAESKSGGVSKAYENLNEHYGTGIDSIMGRLAADVAVPLATCVEVAVAEGMEFPGVVEYEVHTLVGRELFQAANSNDMLEFDALASPVDSTGKFTRDRYHNLILKPLLGFFYGDKVAQEVFEARFISQCEAALGKGREPVGYEALAKAVDNLVGVCHGASKTAGWWNDIHTGEPLPLTQERVGDKLMLVVCEIAEAKEGHRKGLMDDHLPHRPSLEVELADALIRIFDLAGAAGMDLGGAVAEKLQYNAKREDHKLENRRAEGGKKT